MKPHIICHMLSSVDGKTDAAALKAVTLEGEYEATGAALGGDAWICGRTTMQQHFAQDGAFQAVSHKPAGPQPVYAARKAGSYAISVDTHGKLTWQSSDLDGDHLICVLSEQVSEEYLTTLRQRGISFIVTGANEVDLVKAVDLLGEHFGVQTLLLEGGGHINGAFLDAGLVDELSLLLVPGIDGRYEVPAVFDGLDASKRSAVPLKLQSVQQRSGDALWLRYTVEHSVAK